MAKKKKYKVMTIAQKNFLDDLRASGQANMVTESSDWLMEAFTHLTRERAIKIVAEWMESFGKDNEYTW